MAATGPNRIMADCSKQRATSAGRSKRSGADGEIKVAMALQRYADEKQEEKAMAHQTHCCRKMPKRAEKPHSDAPSAELAAN